MSNKAIQAIIKSYECACNEAIEEFCKKQDIEFDGWVSDEIGGIALFISQYSFSIDDIILDLRTKQPKGLILQWQDDYIEESIKVNFPLNLNYKSYTMGARFNLLTNLKQ